MSRTPAICGHCQEEQRGFAAVYGNDGSTPLCHPDKGLDCYHLVTDHEHPMPHPDCPGGVYTIGRALS